MLYLFKDVIFTSLSAYPSMKSEKKMRLKDIPEHQGQMEGLCLGRLLF